MYYENDHLILVDLEQGVREQLEETSAAFMATPDRSKSFKILQHMKKSFPDCYVARSYDLNMYLISISERYEEI